MGTSGCSSIYKMDILVESAYQSIAKYLSGDLRSQSSLGRRRSGDGDRRRSRRSGDGALRSLSSLGRRRSGDGDLRRSLRSGDGSLSSLERWRSGIGERRRSWSEDGLRSGDRRRPPSGDLRRSKRPGDRSRYPEAEDERRS